MCPVNSSSVVYDVIIIGAGISGLGAARLLSQESFNVLVLEARNRPGGRIHSVRLPSVSECTAGGTSDQSTSCNHDNLSVFHTDSGYATPSSTNDSLRNESVSSSPSPTASELSLQSSSQDPSSSSPTQSSTSTSTTSSSVEVDLGANYLIGCSNRQSDQPLFHLARLLKVPTAASVGDLCKKYRGWECVELAVWRNHLLAGAPKIPMEGSVEDAVFLFDKVTHLATQYYMRDKEKIRRLQAQLKNERSCDSEATTSSAESDDTFIALSTSTDILSRDSVKVLFERALSDVLQSEARHGVRPSGAFRDATEEGLYESMIARYFCYVNPLHRLPYSVLEELCETTGASGQHHHSATDSSKSSPKRSAQARSSDRRLTSLIDNLAVAYPTDAQREAYRLCAGRKLTALSTGAAGSKPDVAKVVNVSWEDRLVTGRFSDLLRPLLDNVSVVYRAVVREVDWSGGDPEAPVCIRATVAPTKTGEQGELPDGSEEEVVYKARHCIISVPVGVLKGLDERSRIHFTPGLPADKRRAIDRLALPHRGAATHNKVVLHFRAPEDVFWDADAAHLKCPDARLHILNLHRYGKLGVLCAHLWGGSGLSPTGLTDAEVVQLILDLLASMYPQCRPLPRPLGYLVTRWSEDPFALGAYTTGEPESEDCDRVAYAGTLTSLDAVRLMVGSPQSAESGEVEPHCLAASSTPVGDRARPLCVPRLLFAGEGTLTADEAKECTHGALQTGIARAIELLPFLALNTCTRPGEDSPSSQEADVIVFMPDIPRQKIVHYLLGRIPSRKLAIDPTYTPLGYTDDSTGVADGFVVRRPKRLSTMTSRYPSGWGVPSDANSPSDGDKEGGKQLRVRDGEPLSRVGGRRGGSLGYGKRKASKEGEEASRLRVKRRQPTVETASETVLTSPPRPGCTRGRARTQTPGHRRQQKQQQQGFKPGSREEVHTTTSFPLERNIFRFVGQQKPLLCTPGPHELAAVDRNPRTTATSNSLATTRKAAIKSPADQLLGPNSLAVDIHSSFQFINDCWPALDPATRQTVAAQLNSLLKQLKARQRRSLLTPATTAASATVHIDPLVKQA